MLTFASKHMHMKKDIRLYSLLRCLAVACVALLVAACGDGAREARVDSLNDASYAAHYRSLDATSRYAMRALALARSTGYGDGEAEALNNLAFVRIAHMDYPGAYALLDSVRHATDNQIELLVGDVQLMRLCQRQSDNKNFYHHNQRALSCLRRIAEDEAMLSPRQRSRMAYARSEYYIVLSTYLYYVGLKEKSSEALMNVDNEAELARDTAQTLAYLYNVGSGGMLHAKSHSELQQREFDYLMRCYMLSRQYRYAYWEANSMQAISEHIQRRTDRLALIADNEQEFDYINVDQVADSLLAGNLAERALTLFEKYGDVYQTAGSWRTLSEAYRSLGDYPSALICLDNALGRDTAINAAPDLVASIREQLSIVYSAMDDKPSSDYNRNVYLDLQERTRQDRQLEARAEQLDSSLVQLDMMIVAVVVMIVAVVAMLVYFGVLRHRRRSLFSPQRMHEPLALWNARATARLQECEERLETIGEQTAVARCQLDSYLCRGIEQRAKVWLASAVMPIINRMIHELQWLAANGSDKMSGKIDERLHDDRLDYVAQCLQTIEAYNSQLTRWIQLRRGDFSLHVESFRLEELFDTLRKSAAEYRMRGISLVVEPTDAVVKADRTLTLFMLNTIAENARRFTPSGGTVRVDCTSTERYVEIGIADNGCGMSQEQLSSLFTHSVLRDDSPHASGSAGNDGGGHGFGLLNCKGIIEKYRKISSLFAVCDIGATSRVGEGSRLFFRLPKGVARIIAAIAVMALSATTPSVAAKPLTDDILPATAAAAFADSAYFCNLRGDYTQTLAYADSCLTTLNRFVAARYPQLRRHRLLLTGDYPAVAAELVWLHDSVDVDFGVVLDVRNETAVAALALHRWALYSYNNAVYTQLFRERSADTSLPDYVRTMQRAESNRSVAMVMLVVLFVSIFPLYYIFYYRHRLYYHLCVSRLKRIADLLQADDSLQADNIERQIDALWTYDASAKNAPPAELTALVDETRRCIANYREQSTAFAAKEDLAADELRLVLADRDRLYVANNVLDNCLSALKHETMYYPSRLAQLAARDGKLSEVLEMAEYYRLIYSTLLAHASTTLESVRRLVKPQTAMRLLMDILRRKNNGVRPHIETDVCGDGYVVLDVTMDAMRLTPETAKSLFTPTTTDVDFLVCCQILRDIGETTGARACGIAAHAADDCHPTLITIKTTEKIWKNSL